MAGDPPALLADHGVDAVLQLDDAGALFLWWRLERRGWQPAAAAARRSLAAIHSRPLAA